MVLVIVSSLRIGSFKYSRSRVSVNTRKTVVIAANLTLFSLALVSNDVKIFLKFFMSFRYVQVSCWHQFQRWKPYGTLQKLSTTVFTLIQIRIQYSEVRSGNPAPKCHTALFTVVPMEHIFFSVLRPICLLCPFHVWELLF